MLETVLTLPLFSAYFHDRINYSFTQSIHWWLVELNIHAHNRFFFLFHSLTCSVGDVESSMHVWFVKSVVRKRHSHSLPKILTHALYLCSPGTCQATETDLFWIQLNRSKVGLSTSSLSELLYLQTVAQAVQLCRFHRFSLKPHKNKQPWSAYVASKFRVFFILFFYFKWDHSVWEDWHSSINI